MADHPIDPTKVARDAGADLVDIYIDGHYWTRMSRAQFEREYDEAAPMRRAIRDDFEAAVRREG